MESRKMTDQKAFKVDTIFCITHNRTHDMTLGLTHKSSHERNMNDDMNDNLTKEWDIDDTGGVVGARALTRRLS